MEKLPIKRVELSLNKFNDVAIPHHIGLLKRHKENITKYTLLGDLIRLKSEEINARRTVLQLKNLLQEMDMLRQRVIDKDIDKFDKLTKKSLLKSLAAIKEYLDLYQRNVMLLEKQQMFNDKIINSPSRTSLPMEKDESCSQDDITLDRSPIQLVTYDDEIRLDEKRQCLQAWEDLHKEMEELHGLFVNFQDALNSQRCNIDQTENYVEQTAENVSAARQHLALAEKYGAAIYPVTCAVIGACIGGPIGLVLGLKIGGAAALGGSFIGFTGGRFLKKRSTANEEISQKQNDSVIHTSNRTLVDLETELNTLPPG